MSRIIFNPPGPDTPGFLRRTRRALELREQMQGGKPTPKTVDDLVEFLLPYVSDPPDRDQARELLWDASEADFKNMLHAVTGGEGENPTA